MAEATSVRRYAHKIRKNKMQQSLLDRPIFDKTSGSLSVVIPTVGRDCILKTLSVIETWNEIPAEILIIIPYEAPFSLVTFATGLNIIEIRAPRGQVAQRLVGFNTVSSEFVLQMDDDIIIDSESISALLEAIKNSSSCVVAPTLYQYPSGLPWEFMRQDVAARVTRWIIGKLLGVTSTSPHIGKITRAGVPFGVDPRFMQNNTLEVDWAPGGILLHRRKNLILDQYFPYEGRASHEDLFHSLLLRRKGLKIFTVRSAKAYHPTPEANVEPWGLLIHGLRINLEFVKQFGFSKSRFFIWASIKIFFYLVKKIFM